MRSGVLEQQPLAPEATYEAASGVVYRTVDDSIVLLDLDDGLYYTLEGIACDMWSYLSNGLSLPQIVNALVDEYEVEPSTVRNDLDDLVRSLLSAGLVCPR